MGNKTIPGEFMLKATQELSSKYHVSDTVASMAVLSANICRIHDDLRKISNSLESIIYEEEERASFLRVCGAIDTFEQN